MFTLFSKTPKTIQINGNETFIAAPKETILKASLNNGINFPYSCKVGGCAACKCQLVKGKVKQLTDAGYILSGEDLQNNYILACQSIPKSDIVINVDLSSAAARQISGKVKAQKKLTHDITQLDIQLDEEIRFKSGQYARLTLKNLSDISRPYSFASKPQSDLSIIRFFIREVVGGTLSTIVNQKNIIDENVIIEGPVGDFYLRESSAPLLLVAGGSGLAPVLALLQEALSLGADRPVTLLFGARTQEDLYCIDEIDEISRQWKAPFTFTQVLSDEPDNSNWSGPRGWVGDEITRLAQPDWQAYLCGPPAMIDLGVEQLVSKGVDEKNIFADRFISEHQSPTK